MLLTREVGDVWMAAVCNTNLGNASRSLGEYDLARKLLCRKPAAHHKFDDRWSLAFLLEDVGMLAAMEGDVPSALELMGAADALREGSKVPRPPSRQEEIDNELAAAAGGMSEHEREMLRGYGKSLDLPAAVEHALAFCEEPVRRGTARNKTVGSGAGRRAARVASNSRA